MKDKFLDAMEGERIFLEIANEEKCWYVSMLWSYAFTENWYRCTTGPY